MKGAALLKNVAKLFRLRAHEGPVLLAVLLVGLSLGALLENRDHTRHETIQRVDAAQVGIETLQQVTDRVSRMALGLSRLTTTAEVLPELDPATFESIAQRIVFDVDLRGTRFDAGTSSILSIAYAPDEIVELAYPIALNRRLIGLDYRMRCLRPIEIFGVQMLTGIWLSGARGRQGVPGELICEDMASA